MCGSCDVRFNNLSEVKAHLGEEHEGKHWSKVQLQHGKQDRANLDIISSEFHEYEKLFPEMFAK